MGFHLSGSFARLGPWGGWFGPCMVPTLIMENLSQSFHDHQLAKTFHIYELDGVDSILFQIVFADDLLVFCKANAKYLGSIRSISYKTHPHRQGSPSIEIKVQSLYLLCATQTPLLLDILHFPIKQLPHNHLDIPTTVSWAGPPFRWTCPPLTYFSIVCSRQ